MRVSYAKSLITINLLALFAYGAGECKEIDKELKKLQSLKAQLQAQIDRNTKLLQQIKNEKTRLQELNATIQNQIKAIRSERIKKLAKDFESMDPEYAGEKLSKMADPSIAAYILFNMNSRKAGEALNYVTPDMVSKITTILTKLRKNGQK